MTMHYPKTEAEWLKLRHSCISSTESAALMGLGSYQTPFEIGLDKQRAEPPPSIEQNERVKWGKRLQHTIAKGISEDFGVKVRRVTGYAMREDCRLGASFDYEICGILQDEQGNEIIAENQTLQMMYRDLGPGVLEIKNVDYYIFRQQWKKDEEGEELEAPPQFEIQVQHQLEAIGTRKWAVIGVLIGGNDTQIVIREYDPEFGAEIRRVVDKFWADLGNGVLPPVTLPADVEVLRRIYLSSTPGKVYNGAEDEELALLCREYDSAKDLAKTYEEARKAVAVKILQKIGDSELATAPGFKISATTVPSTWVERFEKKAFRMLRITKLKAGAPK